MGEAPPAAHAAHQLAINEAQGVYDDDDATQSEVNVAVATFNAAIDDFKAQIIADPGPDGLIRSVKMPTSLD